MTIKSLLAAGFAAALIAVAAPAAADDVGDAIEDARRAYRAGDVGAAKTALDLASRLLAERSAGGLARFLPAAPAGWTAGEAETDASTAAAFGGGLIAKRRYAGSGRDVTVLVLANSPLIAQVAPLFSSAQLLGVMGRAIRVRGKTALLAQGKIQVLLGRTLVIIEGSGSEADKRAFLDALDLAAIEAFNG